MDIPRQIALITLYEIEKNKAYSNIQLDGNINKNINKINQKDISFISQLVYGVITWKLTLDEIIKKYSSVKIKKISIWILNILRMGIYQIIFLDKVPKSASVNECVELAKRYGHNASSRFVNAVLRKVSEKDYEEFFNIKNDVERISKTKSMPEWIVKKLISQRNIQEVEKICENLNKKPELTVRINKLKITNQNFKKKLEERGIQYEETILKDFLILKNLKQIEKIDIFEKGYFTIQDQSAGFTAIYLNPRQNEEILDACSAPGGKTTYISELMEDTGKIVALDKYEHRISLVEQNRKRLGITNIQLDVKDACIVDEKLKNKFDKILLDVPCMGIGVIKRKPDIKWQRSLNDLASINKIQKQILQTCSYYLKKGGEMVYSTCSILNEENEDIIYDFLQKNKNFEIKTENIIEKLSSNNIQKNKKQNLNINNIQEINGMIKINPDYGFDGFFICKLLKNR